MAGRMNLGIQALKSAAVASSPEERFLSANAPSLTRVSERFWLAPGLDGDISYPADAQEKLSLIEESSFWFRHRNDVIHAMVRRFPPNGPLLDVGGGNGHVAAGLKARGFPALVVEPSGGGAGVAHQRGLTVVRGGLKPGTFADGSVPAIGLFDVIEHIDDDVGFLSICRRSLADDGHLFVSVPALPALWSADDVYAGHFRRHTKSSLRVALASAGLEAVALTFFFSLLVPPVFLLRTLPTLLGRRRLRDADAAFSHHGSPGAADFVTRALAFETGFVAKGRSLPFGTSLLAVARRLA